MPPRPSQIQDQPFTSFAPLAFLSRWPGLTQPARVSVGSLPVPNLDFFLVSLNDRAMSSGPGAE